MAKNEKAGVAAAHEGEEYSLTLDEFCIRLSRTDKRVELLAAFAHTEKAAGRTKDVESAYAARFNKFINQSA